MARGQKNVLGDDIESLHTTSISDKLWKSNGRSVIQGHQISTRTNAGANQ